MIEAAFQQLGLTSGQAARLLGVGDRNLRRWRRSQNQMPPEIRDALALMLAHPGSLDALRDEYDPTDPTAGPQGVFEPARRLRWLRARFPD